MPAVPSATSALWRSQGGAASTVRGHAYRHNPDKALAVGTRLADRCWDLDERLAPSRDERVLSALVMAVAAAVDDEDLWHAGLSPSVSYLDIALAVAGHHGDRVGTQLMQRVTNRSLAWRDTLAGFLDTPTTHRALLMVAVHSVVLNAVSLRDVLGGGPQAG